MYKTYGKQLLAQQRADEVLNLDNHWQCVYCHENQKNVVYMPCRHLAVCKDCDRELQESADVNLSTSCLMCRQAINERIEAFVASTH